MSAVWIGREMHRAWAWVMAHSRLYAEHQQLRGLDERSVRDLGRDRVRAELARRSWWD